GVDVGEVFTGSEGFPSVKGYSAFYADVVGERSWRRVRSQGIFIHGSSRTLRFSDTDPSRCFLTIIALHVSQQM
ncbi:hypothetical protein, partial [Trueperella pyogenes]|uniref:hypothetical protein n=1 Tax=Trueperella pyogenes TaxID=1661 RepID=UPI001C4E1718